MKKILRLQQFIDLTSWDQFARDFFLVSLSAVCVSLLFSCWPIHIVTVRTLHAGVAVPTLLKLAKLTQLVSKKNEFDANYAFCTTGKCKLRLG